MNFPHFSPLAVEFLIAMRLSLWSLLISLAIAGKFPPPLNNSSSDESIDSFAKVTIEIFNDFYVKFTPVVNVIKSVELGGLEVADEIIKRIMGSSELKLSLILQNFNKIQRGWRRKIEFCVMFVDTHRSFSKIFKRIQTSEFLLKFIKIFIDFLLFSGNFEFQGYFLIFYLPINNISTPSSDITKIFINLWSKYVINVNILTPSTDGASIDIYTYFPFSNTYCEEVHPQIYNNFNLKTGFLKKLPHFPSKTKNFHNCEIKIATFEFPPFNMFKENGKRGLIHWGLEGFLTTVIGLEINANFKEIFTHKSLWKNSSGENAIDNTLKLSLDGQVNMSIGFMTTTNFRNSKMSSTYSYYTTNLVWVIGAEKPLTALQILSKPFQKQVWGWVWISLFLGFIVIKIIKCYGKKVKENGNLNYFQPLKSFKILFLEGKSNTRT